VDLIYCDRQNFRLLDEILEGFERHDSSCKCSLLHENVCNIRRKMKRPVFNASYNLNTAYDGRRLGRIAVLREIVTGYKHRPERSSSKTCSLLFQRQSLETSAVNKNSHCL